MSYQDESLPGNRLSRGADRFVLTEVEAEVTENGAPRKLTFVLATSNAVRRAARRIRDGCDRRRAARRDGASASARRAITFLALRFGEKLTTGPEAVITLRLKHESDWRRATIGRFRLALSAAEHSWPELGDSARKARMKPQQRRCAHAQHSSRRGLPAESAAKRSRPPEEERTEEQQQAVLAHFQWASPQLQSDVCTDRETRSGRAHVRSLDSRVLMTERRARASHAYLPRGNFLDESGEIVEPAIPRFRKGQTGRQHRDAARSRELDRVAGQSADRARRS